jgi:hypothetical protein
MVAPRPQTRRCTVMGFHDPGRDRGLVVFLLLLLVAVVAAVLRGLAEP